MLPYNSPGRGIKKIFMKRDTRRREAGGGRCVHAIGDGKRKQKWEVRVRAVTGIDAFGSRERHLRERRRSRTVELMFLPHRVPF